MEEKQKRKAEEKKTRSGRKKIKKYIFSYKLNITITNKNYLCF